MNNKELIAQVNNLMKRAYWNSRYSSEIRRLHNVASEKQKPGLKRIIAEAIAAKTVNPAHAGSYKRFFSRGSFKPYALFFSALFQSHMEKELTEVFKLVLFSESSTSTGSRKAIELAMKSYQKAIGWNEPDAVQALKAAVLVIETFNYKEAPESAQQELKSALETLVNAEVKTSAEIISIKAYSQLSRMQVHYQGTDLHDLASAGYERACYLI
ncbi:hypothetical protein [Pseudomonas syringae group genomosp. 3]|uniref:Uncharacterized protein n=1 Tax=Pseudomonas syringae pv. coriandricola TaxID=264453 RepID=A0A3M3JRI4_9PSED|nr:hypothetical protein [Pseudomonas syringae group genomosp. 3]RMN13420.1 hypothetical protein ALQ65_03660 [Pseudomonas syringae pv. coriandricola]